MPQRVLNENWADYDDRKKKHTDARYFSCEESWEMEYLIRKIRTVYPIFSEARIIGVIDACCIEVRPPRPRTLFIECVMRRLRS